MQSLAIQRCWSRRSAATANPSLHAITSSVSGSVTPLNTTVDAPRKPPSSPRTMAATAAIVEFFEVAASTLIFVTPASGGIHHGPLTDCTRVAATPGAVRKKTFYEAMCRERALEDSLMDGLPTSMPQCPEGDHKPSLASCGNASITADSLALACGS
jgi:hypothetical protein